VTRLIVVAKEFARSPAGRHVTDGPNSGERFREQYLVDALRNTDDWVEIDLRGALSLGSSFLDEAFGGLVREHGIPPSVLRRRLRIRSDLDTYISKIWNSVEDAGRHEGLH
jgi:hypothetical protein